MLWDPLGGWRGLPNTYLQYMASLGRQGRHILEIGVRTGRLRVRILRILRVRILRLRVRILKILRVRILRLRVRILRVRVRIQDPEG